MRVKTRLAAALSVAVVAGAASWAATGLTGPAGAATGTSGGAWGPIQPVPGLAALTTPATSGSGDIKAITCTTPGNCVAVGYLVSGSGSASTDVPLVMTETSGTWGSPQQIDGTAGLGSETAAGLTKISCADAGDCTATGVYNGSNLRGDAFYATETAGAWSTAAVVSMAGQPAGTNSVITGVSCPPSAPGYCAIVGYYSTVATSTTVVPFVLGQAAGTWDSSPQPVPGLASLSPTGNAELTSVSCAGQGECTAGGGIAGQPFVVSEIPGTPGTWGNALAVTGLAGAIMAISCPDASDCAAAGYYNDASKRIQAFTADEQKGTWGPSASLANSTLLDVDSEVQLGCSAPGNCVLADTAPIIAGSSAYSGAVADSETSSGRWGSLSPIAGFPDAASDDSSVSGVSCAPGGECTIVGDYLSGKFPDSDQGFTVTTSGGGLGSEQPVLPATVAEPLNTALSCPQTGFCTLAYSLNGAPDLVTEATGATVTLKASAAQATYGSEQAETLTATVSGADGGTPAGTVAVTDGATPVCTITLAGGQGTCSLSATAIPAGTDTLTATYSGNAAYVAATSTATVTVSTPPVVSRYTAIAPVRVLDTRNGTGGFHAPVKAGTSIALKVTGQDGVPASGVTAVVLNLTATGPTANGWVVAYPDGQPRPAQGSNLNFTKGETIPNLVTVAVGSDGKVDLYNSAGGVNLVADLQGYYTASGGSGLVSAAPLRVLDTRVGTGSAKAPVGAGKYIALKVTGQDGVPASGVTAVVLNVTATGPAAGGYVSVYPDGQARPASGSNLNFTKGETIPNLVIARVGSDGKVDLYNGSGGTVSLVADLSGYYTASGGSALFSAAPVRVLDTRVGTGGAKAPVAAGKYIALQVTGQDGVPASGVTAVVLNVTATGPTAGGYVTAYPDGQPRPAQGSNLNFAKGETIPNLVIVAVGSDGKVDLYNGSGGTVSLIADLQGYFAS